MSLRSDSWCFDIPGVLTRPRPHSPHITQCKTTQLFWWNIFHWNMLSPLAQVLCYAKHVLLFWNVGSLMSINTSNAEERFLWSWLLGAAFGGVIVLGSGESTDRFWASRLLVERNQMIKPLQVCLCTKGKYQWGTFKDLSYSRLVLIFLQVCINVKHSSNIIISLIIQCIIDIITFSCHPASLLEMELCSHQIMKILFTFLRCHP